MSWGSCVGLGAVLWRVADHGSWVAAHSTLSMKVVLYGSACKLQQ